MYADILKGYIPNYLSSTQTFSELFNSEGIELDRLNAIIDDVKVQLDLSTSTWGLDIYEKDLGIVTDYTKDLDYRRSVIKSKSRGSGKLDATMIKLVCDSFSNGDVQVTFDGTIHVKFTSVEGLPPNMDDLQKAVNEIKPAYLLLNYLYSYLLIGEIDLVMTLEQLEQQPLSKFAF